LPEAPAAAMVRSLLLGRSQVVRQRILIPPCGGSNPPAPASWFQQIPLHRDGLTCRSEQFLMFDHPLCLLYAELRMSKITFASALAHEPSNLRRAGMTVPWAKSERNPRDKIALA
jgi:hypothetical protein